MQINREQIPVPDRLDEVIKEKMDVLRREHRMRRLRKATVGVGAAAACFMGVLAVGVTNPAWASQIPIIGHIFEKMGDDLNYPGDYSQKARILETEKESESGSAVSEGTEQETAGSVLSGVPAEGDYTRTADGMTVTLSEVYSNGQALNIGIVLHSDEPFQDTLIDQKGKPVIACETVQTYSFNAQPQTDIVYLDGKFTDDYTFAGVMRFDLNVEKEEEAKIPDSFSVNLQISQIVGTLAEREVRDIGVTQEEIEAMSDQEWYDFRKKLDEEDPSWNEFPNSHENYWFDGSWEFDLEVSQNTEDCVTVEVGTNQDGIGIEKIVKTPYEITMYPVDPRPDEEIAESGFNYFPVMLDADGMLMSTGSGGSVNTVAVGDHDVSRVDVYLFEDIKWLDEIKGYWWKTPEGLQKGETLEDGRTFKELCDETCVFHETVDF